MKKAEGKCGVSIYVYLKTDFDFECKILEV